MLAFGLAWQGWIKLNKEHLILGSDVRDVEHQKHRWLSENPGVRIMKEDMKPEPATLLTRIGGKRVPRFSLMLHYEEMAGQQHAASSLAALPQTKKQGEQSGRERHSQGPN
jgi:hypothetical protein